MPFLSKILAKIVKISLKSTLNANIYYYFLLCVKRKRHVPSSIGWDALGINVRLAFSVLDELVEAIPGVVVLVFGQVVVEGLVNGFDVRLDRMTDDIRYTFGRFIDGFEVQRFIIAVQQISLGEVGEAVCSVELAPWFLLLEVNLDAGQFLFDDSSHAFLLAPCGILPDHQRGIILE